MIIDESTLLKNLTSAKKVMLVEPEFPSKLPPLALAKIKSFLDANGIQNSFYRNIIFNDSYDLICITTLFTYYSREVFHVIKNRGLIHRETPVLVGGIMASIMPKVFEKYNNVDVFQGYSRELDAYKPDSSLLVRGNEYDNFSYIFTSRGCPNKCPYCVVWKIEKERWVNEKWKDLIDLDRENIMVMDNNLSSTPVKHLKEVAAFIRDHDKGVSFQSGFDCKYITKDLANTVGDLKYVQNGMRLAFDRIEEDGIFQRAAKTLIGAGISPSTSMMAYVLFNFMDTPKDADYRARECAKLRVRPYPQYYRPLHFLNKRQRFDGKHWTLPLARAFRNFWLNFALYKNMEFSDYLYSKECIDKYRLKKADLKKWEDSPDVVPVVMKRKRRK